MDAEQQSNAQIRKVLSGNSAALNLYATDLHFRAWRMQSGIERLMGEGTSWAIVGGAVRDALIAISTGKPFVFGAIAAADVDIAVSVPVETLPVLSDPAVRSSMTSIDRNSYGGLKVVAPGIGEIDIWTWEHPGEDRVTAPDWRERMGCIDYGLNAVAFVWPHDMVLVHDRFREDLAARHVEILSRRPAQRAVRTVRAAALEVKMEQQLGCPFALGPEMDDEIRWLLEPAEIGNFAKASAYLDEKIVTARWGSDARERFFRECARLGGDAWR